MESAPRSPHEKCRDESKIFRTPFHTANLVILLFTHNLQNTKRAYTPPLRLGIDETMHNIERTQKAPLANQESSVFSLPCEGIEGATLFYGPGPS